MVHFSVLILALASTSTFAAPAPLTKRIAQVISASTAKWEQACLAAGGGQQCNPLSITAFSTLLAAPGPCEQQNAADKMIDLAKTLKNDPTMIQLTQIFVQQPRNTPSSQSVPYCQQAPANAELKGLFQCQYQGASAKTFVGGLAVGAPGTIPFGHSSPLSPAGSCPANPDGPIADGTQLVDLTQNPGVANQSNSGNAATSASAETSSADEGTSDGQTGSSDSSGSNGANCMQSGDGTTDNSDDDNSGTSTTSMTASTTASAPAGTSAATSGFQLQNGQDAQKLNAQFATLNTNSQCSNVDEACVGNSFAQCVNGSFQLVQCPADLICAALPLVNKPGTSIACTTQADAEARIQATGATGGITGA